MKRASLFLAIVIPLLACFSAPVSAKDTWVSVRSRNFLLVGNASEKEIRKVGRQLEQFRDVFSRLFTEMNLTSPVPTTVVVFKSDSSYRPFRAHANSAGYFQSGPDVNYITLSTEGNAVHDSLSVIFHEYTHLLVNNTYGIVPTWFSEGLAEYYSTVSITGDQKVVLGRPIASHIYLLRQKKMLPLRTLFQVDSKSPYYNEGDKQSVFYAESWALVHYLMLGKDGWRAPQVAQFAKLVATGVPMDQAFQQVFAVNFEQMEKELREYVQRDRYPVFSGSFKRKLEFDAEMQAQPLTEAQSLAYLGDLLLHSNRADAEGYLQKALGLDPALAMAHASLGMLRVRQGKAEEARKSLERALTASPQNYLIHYNYAYALSRESVDEMGMVTDFPPANVIKMRAHLRKAIELRPDYPESYNLLALVSMVTRTQLDEATELLKGAVAAAPGRNDLLFMLAQNHMLREDYRAAREIFHKLSQTGSDPELQQRSQLLLDQLKSLEEQPVRRSVAKELSPDSSPDPSSKQADNSSGPSDVVENVDPSQYLRAALRKPQQGEIQVQGMLVRIDCDTRGFTFVIRTAGRLLSLKTDGFRKLNMRSFSPDSGRELTCGPRRPETSVVVSYLPPTDPRGKINGVAKAIEFVPTDFVLNPGPVGRKQ
jgi:Tfp pilus assembly protein PilF